MTQQSRAAVIGIGNIGSAIATNLIKGGRPVHVGGLNQSIRIEVFGDLYEFGALGKTVTAPEAREKVQQQ